MGNLSQPPSPMSLPKTSQKPSGFESLGQWMLQGDLDVSEMCFPGPWDRNTLKNEKKGPWLFRLDIGDEILLYLYPL